MNNINLVQGKDSFSQYLLDVKDKTLLLFSAIGFVSSVYFLLNISEPVFDLRDLKPIAKVGHYQNEAKRRITGSLSWSEIKRGQDLFRGDYIFTSDESSVQVDFINETILDIPSNSLVKIDFTDNLFNLDIVKGLLDINLGGKVKKVNILFKGKKYEIESGKAKIRIQKEGDNLNVFSKEGSATLNKLGSKKTSLSPAKGYSLGAQNLNAINTPVQVLSPSPNQIIDPLKTTQMGFSWKAPSQSKTQIYVSKNASFKPDETKILNKDQGNSLRTGLFGVGTYFFKIVQKNSNGDIKQSAIRSFTVKSPSLPAFLSGNNSLQVLAKRGKTPIVKWASQFKGKYDVKVVDNLGNEKIIKIDDYKFNLPKLAGNKLDWSVKHSSPFAKWSPVKPLKISYDNDLMVNLPGENGTIIKKKNNDKIKVDWNAKKNETFMVSLRSKKDPNKIILEKKVVGNSLVIPLPPLGDYSWDIKSLDYPGIAKTNLPVNIKAHVASTIFPKNKKTLVLKTKKANKIKLNWKYEDINQKDVQLQISKDPDFKEIIVDEKLSESSKLLSMNRPGDFFWKLKYTGNNKLFVDSPTYQFKLRYPHILLPPKLKKRQVIYYRNRKGYNSYKIRIPRVKGAKAYEIEVFKDRDLKKRVFKKKFKKNIAYWVSNREGKYYMRVRIWDKYGQKSKFSNVGSIIFPISPLTK